MFIVLHSSPIFCRFNFCPGKIYYRKIDKEATLPETEMTGKYDMIEQYVEQISQK